MPDHPQSRPTTAHPGPAGPARRRLPRWKLPRPVQAGLWARTPPALFPAMMGLAGLALAWRRGIGAFALPAGLADILAGAIALLVAFALLTMVVKIARRPAVLADDLRILPGRAGMAAAVLTAWLLAALVAPFAPLLGRALWVLTALAWGGLAVAYIRALLAGPAEQRQVTPAWHLMFTGLIVGALAALLIGWPGVARLLFWPALVAAGGIWAVSLRQMLRARPPAPLRPLLAIHLAPVALFGTVSAGLGWADAALGFGLVSVVVLGALVAAARWLLAAGFSPFWGALTFPLAATTSLWLVLGWRLAGGLLLVAATLVILPIAFRIWKMWASGQLATKTNAAIA